MLAVFDIGNSAVKAGFFAGDSLFRLAIPSSGGFSAGAYARSLAEFIEKTGLDKSPDGVIISSVAPSLTGPVSEACLRVFGKEPVFASFKTAKRFAFKADDPASIGPDRIAGAVGGTALFGPPLVTADFGTATTVNFVTGRMEFSGGAILPGLGLMAESLSQGTARLPLAELKADAKAIGGRTQEAIVAGIVIGSAGAALKIISEAERETGERFKLIITGGWAGTVRPWIGPDAVYEPDLVLIGLRTMLEESIKH